MSIKITFRNNLPPIIRRSLPSTENEYFKNIAKPLQKRGKNVHNPENNKEKIEDILKELNEMIGLSKVKKFVQELEAFVEIQKKREKENLINDPLVLHMVFSGNPGSGKTTVARIVGKLFKELGVLQKGHVIECERADLVGEYIGHTANKTRDMINKALGGVLFIDEAYSLARGGEKDFGKEAVDVLVKAMEDHKSNLILILAGYRIEMEHFIQTNPGLRSRFPLHINFPDYTADELIQIGELMLLKKQYTLTPPAKIAFRNMLQNMNLVHPYSGNARMIRNIVEKTIRKQAVRLYRQTDPTREDLISITELDLTNDDL
ncbi:MAG: Stage V sporulation protein K [Candidatus Dichloromethanomonas elyunquensis]|nr:MAG: Stage V sporulation protein K [Candidatus Dichloromethanomonas elyunquensis]